MSCLKRYTAEVSAQKKRRRQRFRNQVFARDRHRCQVCGRQWSATDALPALGRMDAHHITDRSRMPNGGYVPENGITVCQRPCHHLVERYHQTGTAEPGLHPDDLYTKINSSHTAALAADQRNT
ncbi:MAG: HNH endonuclease [Myxococcota bacterium]